MDRRIQAALAALTATAALAACATRVPLYPDESAGTRGPAASPAPAAAATPADAPPPAPAPAPVITAAVPIATIGSADLAAPGTPGSYARRADISAWADEFAARGNVDRRLIQSALDRIEPQPRVRKLILPPATPQQKNWTAYRGRFLDAFRVKAGVEFWNTNADSLARAEAQYGVPAAVIVGIAGVETIYGRMQGDFRTADALATLAFDWPAEAPRDRSAYFREQFEQLLLLARDYGAQVLDWRGSYAGALGIPQFMPGSLRGLAVDFDGDGRIDLSGSPADAIGSIARYLNASGWQAGTPIWLPAKPGNSPDQWIAHDLEARWTADALAEAGVIVQGTVPPDLLFGLVDLTTPNAPTEWRAGTRNFFAITQYNRSFFYAAAVADLAAAVTAARGGTAVGASKAPPAGNALPAGASNATGGPAGSGGATRAAGAGNGSLRTQGQTAIDANGRVIPVVGSKAVRPDAATPAR
ncbi:lytic murein transglycosylase B [Derxia gummosa]|uniref:Lytic murein transglycosylase B n=1 Tax=Derxia gummosa DSM 723 TaxID=1121388 RepID=A0A8B6X912_9BURK|nr:lytic murein transglycosylase B [Derxia gummosa]